MYREQAVEIIERHIDNNIASGSLVEQALSMAIDALKEQLSKESTTSDLIDRRAALDIFDDYNVSVENGELEAYSRDRKRMCELPPAQPEPKWVPCRNDLPDIGVTVLFCDVDGDEFIGHRASDYWWSVDDKVKSVIAWMPLPKPFKGGINEIN